MINRSGHDLAPPVVHEVLRSFGRQIDAAPRRFLETRFGRDFSHVRIHTDPKAAESARIVGALAYAAGRNVVFGAGQYAPQTNAGMSLLTHELSHVVQQSGAQLPPDGRLSLGVSNSPAEHSAEQMARSVASRQPIPAFPSTSAHLMRATRTLALTFDDGPHAAPLGTGVNLTEKVLDELSTRSIQAGFFVQTGVSYRGANAIGKKLIARMHADGHKIGIHTGGTADHELHTEAQKAGRLEGELKSAGKFIEKETGEAPSLVRPPTGKFDKAVSATYAKLGLTNLLWDVDGDQGANLPIATLKTRIEAGINGLNTSSWKPTTPSAPKFVFLYHDIQRGTANNLGAIIDHIKTTTTKVTKGADSADFAAP